MAASSGTGRIPEFTPAEAKTWLDAKASGLTDLTNITVTVLGLFGFAIFLAGLIQYMRENREAAMGGGRDKPYGLYMLLAGGALGAIDALMILVIALMRPATV